ncbi:hypothetical protein Tco_0901536 [Tanacetum coccineum]
MEDDIDINTFTMEQYLARVQDDIRPGVVKPKIGNDVKFEINRNFMRELRRKLFKGTDDEDAHEYLRRVLEIANLFHFPGVTRDSVMLRVFPITLKRPALRWINRLSAGSITTWDLLEKTFIIVSRGEEHDIPLQDGVMQPLTSHTTHITPPDDVAPATSPILDKHSNKFREEFYDITRVVEMADGNPVKDLPNIINTYDFETFILKFLHQVSQSSHETGKTEGGMKYHLRYGSNLSLPYLVANLCSHGVHCYSHSHLILSEGRNTLLLGK